MLLIDVDSCLARSPFHFSTEGGTLVGIESLDLREASFIGDPGSIGGRRTTAAAQYEAGGETGWVVALGHEYDALEIAQPGAAEPETNGDLHTFHLATQWRTGFGDGDCRLALAPAVSVSSNALKNLEVLNGDSVQLWGAAIYSRPVGDLRWVTGLVRDYRFGEGRVYPAVGVEWQGEALFLRAVYPDIELVWQLPYRWELRASMSPDGNEWQAFDRSLRDAAAFRREAWQGRLDVLYRFDNGLEVGGVAGIFENQRWRYRRLDGSFAHLEGERSAFVGLRVGWRLP